MSRRTVRLSITGRVQGVGFRAWTRDEAQGLGLTGWVRNEPDGSVTALLDGSAPAVERMIDRCHEGPGFASVSSVIVNEESAHDELDGFDVTHSP